MRLEETGDQFRIGESRSLDTRSGHLLNFCKPFKNHFPCLGFACFSSERELTILGDVLGFSILPRPGFHESLSMLGSLY